MNLNKKEDLSVLHVTKKGIQAEGTKWVPQGEDCMRLPVIELPLEERGEKQN